jgi:hypothetical protein
MISDKSSVLLRLVSKAIESGADGLEIEYKDGYEEVYVFKGSIGYGITRLKSTSKEAASLRKELYGIGKKKKRITVFDADYELKVNIFESFGDDAFRVKIRRI